MKRLSRKIVSLSFMLILLVGAVSLTPTVIEADASSRTASGLVEHVTKAYNDKWKYVWGGQSTGAVDCSGLIYMYAGGSRTANEQYQSATEKGSISTIPDIPGICVYRKTSTGYHVGVYIGNGMVIDARGKDYGVKCTSLESYPWTKWYKHPKITYDTDSTHGSDEVIKSPGNSNSSSSTVANESTKIVQVPISPPMEKEQRLNNIVEKIEEYRKLRQEAEISTGVLEEDINE